jgi:carbon monoxide dehydrogenase subunit G
VHLIAEESAEIRCSIAEAYEYTCDLEKFGQWFPGVIKIVAEDALDLTATGKSYLETVAIPLRGNSNVRIRVKEAQRNHIFVTEGSLRPLLPRMQIQFRDSGQNSTLVNWQMHSRSQSVLVRATLIPMARRVMKARAKEGMANLKRHLEAKGDA